MLRGCLTFILLSGFIQKLLIAVLVHASLRSLEVATASDLRTFVWHLRPHHNAEDFDPLLRMVRCSFATLAPRHTCPLFEKVQVVKTNTRMQRQHLWHDVGLGPLQYSEYFRGCSCRPMSGISMEQSCTYNMTLGNRNMSGRMSRNMPVCP